MSDAEFKAFSVALPNPIAMLVDESRVFINQNSHSAIVLHKTGGPGDAKQQAEYFATNADMHSVHYVVGQDGLVVQCVLEKDGAGGNCCVEQGYDPFWKPFLDKYTNLNLCSLSIEHCDPSSDNSTPLTPEQKAASFALVKYLMQKYSIPVANIKGHNTIDPVSRAHCPGNYPWSELFASLTTSKVAHIPAGWHYDPVKKEFTCPNGYKVVLGFAEYIANDPTWNSANVALQNETHMDQLEVSPGGYTFPGELQAFRDTILIYAPSIGVQQMHCGQEIYTLFNVVRTLQQQVQDLNVPVAFTSMLSQLIPLAQQTLDTLKK